MLTRQVRRVLMMLVLLNLLFVQITGAVTSSWMIPLFALALGSPYLWDLQRFKMYRVAWNVALMAIFALLIVDVRQTGIRYMLEDGLILAAFCQVHVLNNLVKQKRPDLIFFNSFLIALVTGFFCQDLVYSVVFTMYAVVLVSGLSLSSSSLVGGLPARSLSNHDFRRLVRRSLGHGLTILVLTGLIFAFWPRDFDRAGLVDEDLVDASVASEVAFSDQIRLDRKGNAKISKRVVITADLLSGATPADVPRYWRGATFTLLTRYGWNADTNQQGLVNRSRQIDEPWQRATNGFVRPGYKELAILDVRLDDRRARHLFLPVETNRITFTCNAWPNIDGNFRLSRNDTGEIHYVLHLNHPGVPLRRMPGRPSADHTYLHPRRVPEEARAWSVEAHRGLPLDADVPTRVEALRKFVSNMREYVLPGEPGAAEDLEGFLAGRGGGHCEYFATALTMLLRLDEIPCRMASGYLAHEWSNEGTRLTIRSNHAHAWVEVWDDRIGWYIVDPTPAQNRMTGSAASLVDEIQDWFRGMWIAVTSFDSESRAAVLAWVLARVTGIAALAFNHPVSALLLVLGVFVLRRLRRLRRERAIDPAVREYLGVLDRLKVRRRPGETPRQLLQRVELPPDRLEQLSTATRRHEAARYS